LYVSRTRTLLRADGLVRRRLADLSALGFRSRGLWIEPLPTGLIGVFGSDRVAVLLDDGRVFGSAVFAKDSWPAASGGLVPDRDGRRVAFAVADDGMSSVYILEPHGSGPRLVYSNRLQFAPCARWVDLAWDGDWLLLQTTGGNVVVLDTSMQADPIDLTDFAHTLPGIEDPDEGEISLQASWA
jgi:hypothetical protein